MWRFHLLPENEYDVLLELWEQKDYIKIMMLYNKYKIPTTTLSSCCGFSAIQKWTEYAIDEIIIPANSGKVSSEVLQSDSSG